jgi:hypothetical protein
LHVDRDQYVTGVAKIEAGTRVLSAGLAGIEQIDLTDEVLAAVLALLDRGAWHLNVAAVAA